MEGDGVDQAPSPYRSGDCTSTQDAQRDFSSFFWVVTHLPSERMETDDSARCFRTCGKKSCSKPKNEDETKGKAYETNPSGCCIGRRARRCGRAWCARGAS